jgi:hypothetical protein
VVVSSIQPDVQQGNLFASVQTSKQLALTKVMTEINSRFGNQTIRPTSALKKEQPKVKFPYPLFRAT